LTNCSRPGPWADAATALVELELPARKFRRAVYEGGERLCSLSRQPNLSLELDDTVDARHEKLALAILRAFVETRKLVDREQAIRYIRSENGNRSHAFVAISGVFELDMTSVQARASRGSPRKI
jgi:hypothetical protein